MLNVAPPCAPWRALGVLMVVALLSACATRPPLVVGPEAERLWQVHQLAVATIEEWSINGRIGIQTESEGWHATLRWKQHHDIYDLALSGPLGQGAAQLHGDGQRVVLHLSEQEVYEAADAESLLRARLGWSVPLSGLRYWVRGLPAPGVVEGRELDELGRLSWLTQGGWHIRYRRYDDAAGTALPGKIFLDSGHFKVRLVIERWELL